MKKLTSMTDWELTRRLDLMDTLGNCNILLTFTNERGQRLHISVLDYIDEEAYQVMKQMQVGAKISADILPVGRGV